jgi:hypothetical protein
VTAHRDYYHAGVLAAAEAGNDKARRAATLALILEDLRYPAARDGSVIELRTDLALTIGWHLVRAGWEWYPDRALIKPRPCAGPGTYEDAQEWVSIDAPDDPLADLASMTVADLAALPENLRAEAARRLGVKTEEPPQPTGWVQPNRITITDEPDTALDDIEWK